MALTTGRQTHGLTEKQIQKKEGGRKESKEGRKEEDSEEQSETDSQTDREDARGMGLRDKNPLDIAAWTGRSLSPSSPPSSPLSPCSYTLACADHLGEKGLFLQRDPHCQLPTPTDLGLWRALLSRLQTQ